MSCPHCGHGWSYHAPRCTTCGCQWQKPEPEPSTTPPTTRDQVIARVRDAMFDELDRQHEAGEIDAAGYWDPEWGRLDGEPNWTKVAQAALSVIDGNEADDTMRAYMTEAGWR